MPLTFLKHEPIQLKQHPEFSENWLQDVIAGDPALLGLGDLELIDKERIQSKAGRLDLLLSDGESTRYEVEIMLGQTDPSHIVRCIEYWDAERRLYPGYEHIAVLIAEDITSRFLNVINLMAGNIPMIAIQLNAIQVADHLVLDFIKVLDQTVLRIDDTNREFGGGQLVNRAFWAAKVGEKSLTISERFFNFVKQSSHSTIEQKYLKGRITISEHGDWRNLFVMYPRKEFVHIWCQLEDRDGWGDKLEEAGLPIAKKRRNTIQVTISEKDIETHQEILKSLIQERIGSSLPDE